MVKSASSAAAPPLRIPLAGAVGYSGVMMQLGVDVEFDGGEELSAFEVDFESVAFSA